MTTSRTTVLGRQDLIVQVTELVTSDHEVVTLTGEPGVGKTTVWTEVLAQTHAAWSWTAHCLEAEADLGLAVLADFYRAVPDSDVSSLPAPQRRAVDIALFRDDGDPQGPPGSRLLGATTLSLLAARAEQGRVAIGIDDVQWCDPTSLLAFDYAIHRLRASGIAVLTSSRPGFRRGLSDAVTIPVPPLPAESICALLQQVMGLSASNARVVEIAELSAGNPFFALELARHRAEANEPTPEGLPESISSLLRRRLTGLNEATQNLLLDVAVRGSGEPGQLDSEAATQARQAGLLSRQDGRLLFTHPLLSAAVLEAAPADAIRRAHGRAVRSLQDPIAVALHRAWSTDPDEAVASELDSAVPLARDRGDVHGAVGLAELALRMTPGGARPPQRVMTLANLEYALGHLPRAGELASEVLPADDSPALRASALVCVAASLADGTAGIAMLQEAASISGLPLADYATVVGLTAYALMDNGRLLEALKMLDHAMTVVEDPASEWPALVAIAAYLQRFAAMPCDGLLLSRAVEVERERNASPKVFIRSSHEAISCAASLAVLDDRHEDAGVLLREASVAAACHGELNHSAYFPGILACRVGNPRRALQVFIDAGEADGPNPLAHARMACACVWLGEFDRVDELIARAEALLFSEADRARAEIDYAIALRLVLTRRPAEAWTILRATVDFLDSINYREPSHPPVLPLAVEAACAAGDEVAASKLCARLQRDSTAVQSRFGAAAVFNSRGHISQSQGDDRTAEDHFASAAQAFTKLQVPLEAARSLVFLGSLLRRTGRRSKARAAFGDARRLIVDSHASGLLNIIDAEEARISGRSAPTSPAGLTPSELRVAELAADGMRNSDIARALHLSTKTVETHLGHVYRKLGIDSRARLARALEKTN